MPLTCTEILDHPAFQHALFNLPPTKKGTLAVAKGRGGLFNIAYEIHGNGPIHLVWIAGLGAFKWYWQRQMKDFGHDQSSKYSCLIFDNRGMGESDKPTIRYSTSEMAKDVLELLDHIGWTSSRQIHLVGISMGGMIAQELALLEPERIASLTFVSTAAELINTIGYIAHLRERINILFMSHNYDFRIPKSIDKQIAEIKSRVSSSWLDEPDSDGFFPTNGDRFTAQELTKRMDIKGFTRTGFILQAIAAAYHKKTPNQLQQIADRVGRERIQVMHGTDDNLITFPHVEILVRSLGGEEAGITKYIFKEKGHYLPLEERENFKRLMEGMIEKTQAL